MKMSTHDLVLCALCAAVTCVLAPLSVPLAGEVPISLATFAVLLSGSAAVFAGSDTHSGGYCHYRDYGFH